MRFLILLLLSSFLNLSQAQELAGVPVANRGLYDVVGVATGSGEVPSIDDDSFGPGGGQLRIAPTFVQMDAERFQIDQVSLTKGMLALTFVGSPRQLAIVGTLNNCAGNPPGLFMIDMDTNEWVALKLRRSR